MRPYEAALIDSEDDMQFKVYATSHPEGFIIAKPKYIPCELMEFSGLKKRFLFGRCMTRFNLFNKKEHVEKNLKLIEERYPHYLYRCEKHKNWFLGVPESKVKKFYDTKSGLKELMKVPKEDLDPYLTAVRKMIDLLKEAGVPEDKLGISHSTLLGNYTPGRSDIDILIFGIDNGWKAVRFLEKTEDNDITWKTEADWAKYFKDRVVSKVYSEQEYVKNMVRKRDDGFIMGNVFSLFCIEDEGESWYDWEARHEPLGPVKLRGKVKDAYYSIVRPGYYELGETSILEGHEDIPVRRIVTWARPFVLQATEGEEVEAYGLLEKVDDGSETFHQLVIGYFDTYTTERGEKEYLKAVFE